MGIPFVGEPRDARYWAEREASEGNYVKGVSLLATLANDYECWHEDVTDEDGDNINAKGEPLYSYDEDPLPKLTVPRGTNRREIIAILGKFIALLKSDVGDQVLNLCDGEVGPNCAQRFPDGRVVVYNLNDRKEAADKERRADKRLAAAVRKARRKFNVPLRE